MKRKINKVLIANRSEIASRIISTCHTLGIKTVAIYSPEDRMAPYLYQADEAYPLDQRGIDGYINSGKILSIAKNSNSDSIHPGYGFLAEDAKFAQETNEAGITWIGPDPNHIALMGDKIKARNLMQKIGVPTIPGFHYNKATKKESAKKAAKKIGYPILLKAAFGGGGKAIRKVEIEKEFDPTYSIVKLEAQNLFHSSEIFLEKYIGQARHIEIQVAGDGKNYIHLFERECSCQRRHQKIIEETPCSLINPKTLKLIYKAALKVAKSINYKNLGTVEFILTSDEKFYFLEMNTRLQVEHPITELTTGIDLVALQLQIAENDCLPFKQKDVSHIGHAIECRILAEDPKNNFIPSTGTIRHLKLPDGPFIRHDHALEENSEILPFFDSMISKLIVFGSDRNMAKRRMLKTLNEMNISGIKTNINFLKKIIKSKEFESCKVYTDSLNTQNFPPYKNFLEKKSTADQTKMTIEENEAVAIIAVLLASKKLQKQNKEKNPKHSTSHWRRLGWK